MSRRWMGHSWLFEASFTLKLTRRPKRQRHARLQALPAPTGRVASDAARQPTVSQPRLRRWCQGRHDLDRALQ